VVFSDISNPFFTSVYKGIEFELSKHGYELTLANTSEMDENQEKVLNTMLSREVDGLILSPTGRESGAINKMIEMGLPIVMIDRRGPYHELPLVGLDNVNAAYQAVSHLIADGHRKIGIVLGLEDVDTTEFRLKGYQKALADHGIALQDQYVLDGRSQVAGGYHAARELFTLDQPPTAIFLTNNLMTLGALHLIRDLGLNCPEDIGLIGFDDHEWADIFTPPLTVIRQPTFRMGARAADVLIQKLQEDQPKELNQDLFPGDLIVRGSCSRDCFEDYFENYQPINLGEGGETAE
jgi:DNA-binding LacI/PurR family transcriptional regulator